jgi:hypothetical protein
MNNLKTRTVNIAISHEIPYALFSYHDLINDYPYVLGHLLLQEAKHTRYKVFYKEKLQTSKFSILDNSAFELGKSINPAQYLDLIQEYNPTHFILPDTLHNMEETIKSSIEFLVDFGKSGHQATPIGVLQGNTFEELFKCYETYTKEGIEYIAIPFDCIKDSDWHNIRHIFFKEFVKRYDNKAPRVQIHFLGIQNPSELLLYDKNLLSKISSIDTSSPIMNGLHEVRFGDFGTNRLKPSIKLADNLDVKVSFEQHELITYNINKFFEYVNR